MANYGKLLEEMVLWCRTLPSEHRNLARRFTGAAYKINIERGVAYNILKRHGLDAAFDQELAEVLAAAATSREAIES